MTQPAAGAYPAVPGPSDRVHFERMQARQRRAVHLYGFLGLLAVAVAGIPVSLVVTPLVFFVGLLSVRVAALFVAIPPAIPELAREIGTTVRRALAVAIALQWPALDARTALLLFVPGAIAMFALWFFVRRFFAHVPAGGALLTTGTRDPRPTDFEEHQLENAVGEMAIAAGTRSPALRLLDVAAANAAAVGTGPGDATLVVTRGLLERLNREQTQAIIGHLIASIGNGDLTASRLLLSVQQTLGLLTVILNAPFGPASRRVLRMLLHPGRTPAPAIVADLLSAVPLETDDDVARKLTSLGSGSPIRILKGVALFPFLFPALAARVAAALVLGGVFGPVFAALWRRRRRVADAMAVQLTRNPDALARGLEALASGEHHIEGALTSAHLFIAWQPDQSGRYLSRVFGGLGTLTPSLRRRLQALRRMGAESVGVMHRTWKWRDLLQEPTRTILLVLPALVIVGGYATALVLWVMITFNFLLVGLLVVALNGVLDLAARVLTHLVG